MSRKKRRKGYRESVIFSDETSFGDTSKTSAEIADDLFNKHCEPSWKATIVPPEEEKPKKEFKVNEVEF